MTEGWVPLAIWLRDFCGSQYCSVLLCADNCNGVPQRYTSTINHIPIDHAPTNQGVGSSNLSGRANLRTSKSNYPEAL
jgi:hypothetical protein